MNEKSGDLKRAEFPCSFLFFGVENREKKCAVVNGSEMLKFYKDQKNRSAICDL